MRIITRRNSTRKNWERYERSERLYRDHPILHWFLRAELLLEGIFVGVVAFGLLALLVRLALRDPLENIQLLAFLAVDVVVFVINWASAVQNRFWKSFPAIRETDAPGLHAFVRETVRALKSPPIHHIRLDPFSFNACVTSQCPLIPFLRRNILVVGYPLLAASSERSFRGVLAHELGHIAHHDTIRSGAIQYVRAFWTFIWFGTITALLVPWRRWYIGRMDRLMAPLDRAAELAADRESARLFGEDTLREMLVLMELRAGCERSLETCAPILDRLDAEEPFRFAESIRSAMRAPVPEHEVRRKLGRALRSIVPPDEPHPPLAVRTGTDRLEDLLPFVSASADALERLFGSETALDETVDAEALPVFRDWAAERADARGAAEARLRELDAQGEDSPAVRFARVSELNAAGRTDEAQAAQAALFRDFPDDPDVRVHVLCDRIGETEDSAEAVSLAAELRKLVAEHPLVSLHACPTLYAYGLESGDVGLVKTALDLQDRSACSVARICTAKISPTDRLEPYFVSDGLKAEIERIGSLFPGARLVEAVIPVRRLYDTTGIVSGFLLVVWSRSWRCRFSDVRKEILRKIEQETDFGNLTLVDPPKKVLLRVTELGFPRIPIPKKKSPKKP